MKIDELSQVPKMLSDMEQRIKHLELERENAGMLETSQQESTPKSFDSSKASEQIRTIMKQLYSNLAIGEFATRNIDITDIIFLMKDGTIKHFEF